MRWRGWRAAAAGLAVCGLVAGCGTAQGAAATGTGRLADIATRNFVYRGGCGWDKPALDTPMAWGRQTGLATRVGALPSRAEVVDYLRVRLGAPAKDYLAVRVQCSIGDRTATGWHLLGFDGTQAVDLGIVAAAYGPVDVRVSDGQLVVRHEYRRTSDHGLSDTGVVDYRVAVVGATPVRLYGDQQTSDAPSAVAGWAPNAWRAGVVTLVRSTGQAGATSPHLGVQTDPLTALTTDDLTVGDAGCTPVATWTHAGQRIDPARTAGWVRPDGAGQRGTKVTLSLPTDAPDMARVARPSVPLGTAIRGLLVTGSGLVPALADAGTGTGTADTVPVTSLAPSDDQLEDQPFGGPTALFRDADGTVLLAGRWTAPGPAEGAGMRPMPDPAVLPLTGC
ncbi:hypothetical protein [Raineyella fluvialis]|uniref:Uncharacterized protein n=1 Tax=Raineyella fluvialis TaxID=2662261 RepID=A0A5Q2FB69_9ACTN|nr:hypothetical protein [Raineyella fluvialis]QGF22967.1 hypothetical protein Rai3103_03995 [Raineyella fluvialis]